MDTSWVGVIGVGIGAALTGLVSVVQTQLQRKSQNEALAQQARTQAQIESHRLSADRWKWHADLRRQSYVNCLISVERCSNYIEAFGDMSEMLIARKGASVDSWARGESPAEYISRFNRQVVEDTFDAIQMVRLDGPAEVAAQARKLLSALLDYWVAAQGIVKCWEKSWPYSQVDHDKFTRLFGAFRDNISEFITLASNSLNEVTYFENSAGFPS